MKFDEQAALKIANAHGHHHNGTRRLFVDGMRAQFEIGQSYISALEQIEHCVNCAVCAYIAKEALSREGELPAFAVATNPEDNYRGNK